MTDSMKFGPEWLRNLSSEGNPSSTSGGGNRYYLAEHRYGREEMLALFEQSLKLRPPASMLSFTTLFVDQALNPLALAPMTEEENRMWSGRAVPPGAPRGRGGSMDRGRGRGRGGTFHPGFNRSNSSFDEPMRSFDRSQSDRGWSERNGEIGDWGVSSSPRKEFGSSRGGSNNTDNWRRHRIDDPDSDGWRTMNHRNAGLQEKWSAGGGRSVSNNWRDGDTREEHVHLSDRQANNRVSWHSTGDSRTSSQRRMFDMDDHLPEWATENPSESGGTFDASGAFHGSDDEFPPEKGSTPVKLNTGGNSNTMLQKSASQQNIPPAKKSTPLCTSQSATNLAKKPDDSGNKENKEKCVRDEKSSPAHQSRSKKSQEVNCTKEEPEQHMNNVHQPTKKEEVTENNISRKSPQTLNNKQETITNTKKVDDEFDHMKEVTDDIVAKLILDDEVPKLTTVSETQQQQQQRSTVNSAGVTQLSYPTGLMPPPPGTAQDKWYYRDPQGEVQGPFTSQEMADWFRAGYFTISLLVRRQCDERYFTLGDLVKQCPGIPFLTCRLPPLKPDPVNLGLGKVPPELADPLQLQQLHMQTLLQRHAEAVRALSQTEPWGALSHLQQRELITQHMMAQPQQGLTDMPFIPQIPNTQLNNPLMHMINQMQQANKLPVQTPIVDKPPNSINTQHLDPLQQLVQQMGGMQPQLQTPAPAAAEPAQQTEDPIKSLLRQLASQQPQRDIWDIRGSQAPFSNQPPQPQQWQAPAPGPGLLPHSLWDLHAQNTTPVVPPPIVTPTSVAMQQRQSQTPHGVTTPVQPSTNVINDTATKEQYEREEQKKKAEIEKEQKARERKEAAEREKKKKEQEQLEKLRALKEAEEKRRDEQRKREAEKKAEIEKQKKEEERIRKELEKAKREAEEKKAKELEEKRKLKEQKKADEEARKKQEEDRKREEEEDKQKKEAERQEQARRQAEALRRMQEQQQRTKVAPWCQTASETSSLSLAEIQRAEREKRAEQSAILLQQQRAMAVAKDIQEQQVIDKSSLQLKWATKKPAQPKKVKSLAEIQAEEQERIMKQAADARILQQQKEKESTAVPVTNTSIWSTASQSLTWTTNSHSSSGFWDDSVSVQKTPTKPNTIRNNAPVVSNANTMQPQANNNKTNGKVNKSRVKKEEQQVMKLFDKNDKNDEFAAWCTKTLATLNGDVDIPTFVGFLRDIESPYEVKDYVRQYLGDSPQALHFANQFVERRSRVKELQRAALQHKDDLCQPAPAINPSSEFQEVKGKGKKSKKSKMMKVDARILGFSVTAAEDRLNVGDRDYGDNI